MALSCVGSCNYPWKGQHAIPVSKKERNCRSADRGMSSICRCNKEEEGKKVAKKKYKLKMFKERQVFQRAQA